MARTVLRKADVLGATGWSNSTLYTKIAEGTFPKGAKIDPGGRVVFWFDDQVAELQKAAAERQAAAA